MNYLQFNFSFTEVHPFRDILVYELGEIGFESFVETDSGLQAFIQENDFVEAQFSEVIQRSQSNSKIEFSKERIAQQNWNAEWESNFQPIIVSENCRIRAPFHQLENQVDYDIIIQPQMSFGTGHHETTFLISAALYKMNLNDQIVLDMGSGTGVLAILAEKKGAKLVYAIDNDDWAVSNCKDNCKLNNTKSIIVEKGESELLEGRAFNLILANINRNVLLADLEVYCKSLKNNGLLMMSGFFVTDADFLKSKAGALGLKFVEQKSKNDWAMLVFKK